MGSPRRAPSRPVLKPGIAGGGLEPDASRGLRLRRTWPWALAVVAALLLATGVAKAWPFTVDDTYITLRYSRNLALGLGPTFNATGPRAEGYTTLSWMLLLALPHRLGLDAVFAAKALGVAATFATFSIAARWAWSEGRERVRPAGPGSEVTGSQSVGSEGAGSEGAGPDGTSPEGAHSQGGRTERIDAGAWAGATAASVLRRDPRDGCARGVGHGDGALHAAPDGDVRVVVGLPAGRSTRRSPRDRAGPPDRPDATRRKPRGVRRAGDPGPASAPGPAGRVRAARRRRVGSSCRRVRAVATPLLRAHVPAALLRQARHAGAPARLARRGHVAPRPGAALFAADRGCLDTPAHEPGAS